MRISILALLCACAVTCQAYQPQPGQRSAGEEETKARLEVSTTDSAKAAVAKESLEKYPQDIAVSKLVIDLLMKNLDDPITYFQTGLERDNLSPTAHFLYGRVSKDSTTMAQEAQWILTHHPGRYWGFELAGYAE